MFQFSWSSIIPNIPYMLHGMITTIEITLISVIMGVLFGIVLVTIHLSSIKIISWCAKIYINLFRSVPLIMVLLWFYLIIPKFLQNSLGFSPQIDIRLISAIIAFSLFEAAYFSEIIRSGITSIGYEQLSAALALGMTYRQSMQFVIVPQALKAMLPLLLMQGIIVFQDTSLVYVLSLTDFFQTTSIIGERDGTQIEMILFAGLVYFIVSVSASTLVDYTKRIVK